MTENTILGVTVKSTVTISTREHILFTWIHAGLERTLPCVLGGHEVEGLGSGCFWSLPAAGCVQTAWHLNDCSVAEKEGTAGCWNWRGWKCRCCFGTWPQLQELQKCNARFHSLVHLNSQNNQTLLVQCKNKWHTKQNKSEFNEINCSTFNVIHNSYRGEG